ncbi:hypothetical protein DA075_04175 [Methylobacterium currus]|uniref:Uncharacterized protein n=1 Tax=Methylobacterium currus TaxID=2051553 RepID=A0A2R4WFA6_9HYPH|nr:hypothetical protein [Methylobacterium currus]AWB20230.1 hypothetical protein DA075_04175 [Methylobacterium currus]UHC15019.1 hypothetical protein LRS73_21150 [Methylobacterium currus]
MARHQGHFSEGHLIEIRARILRVAAGASPIVTLSHPVPVGAAPSVLAACLPRHPAAVEAWPGAPS